MTIDLNQTRTYLEALTGSPDTKVTWQWFADPPRLKGDKSLCGHRHGSLDDLSPMLTALNARGAGIFVTVNATDGEGRKSENVTGLRALFVDDDTAQDLRSIVPPNIRVQSKRGQQWYWLLEDGESLDQFRPAQLALAAHFHTDSSVTDLPRVMRVPGFEHVKGDPFDVKVVGTNPGGPYTVRGLLADMGLELAPIKERKAVAAMIAAPGRTPYGSAALASECSKITSQPEGGRHKAIFAAAAACAELVAGGHLEQAQAVDAITSAARQASNNGDRVIDDREIEEAIADGWARGCTKPRGPEGPPPPSDHDAPHDHVGATPEDLQALEREPGCDDDKGTPKPVKPTPIDRLKPITQADAAAAWRTSGMRQCVPTGIADLDKVIGGGLPVGQITTILGYAGTGKSEVARQIKNRVAAKGHAVVHVDVELGATRIYERDLSQESGIAPGTLNKGAFTDAQALEMHNADRKIQDRKHVVTLSPGGGIPLDLLTKGIDDAIAQVATDKPTLLVIDSLQRLAAGAAGSDQRLQTQNFLWWMEALARPRNVAVIVTCEQRRTSEGKQPSPSDALTSGAESRAIEFVSDVVLALVPKANAADDDAIASDLEDDREVRLLVCKNRHGGVGYLGTSLVFQSPCWGMKLETAGAGDLELKVMDALKDGETKTWRTMTAIIKRRRGAIKEVLVGLKEQGKAEIVMQGTKELGWRLVRNIKPLGAVDCVPKAGHNRITTNVSVVSGHNGKNGTQHLPLNGTEVISLLNQARGCVQEVGHNTPTTPIVSQGGLIRDPPDGHNPDHDRPKEAAKDTAKGIVIDLPSGDDEGVS
jgi:RecA/RadA recombinase